MTETKDVKPSVSLPTEAEWYQASAKALQGYWEPLRDLVKRREKAMNSKDVSKQRKHAIDPGSAALYSVDAVRSSQEEIDEPDSADLAVRDCPRHVMVTGDPCARCGEREPKRCVRCKICINCLNLGY